MIRSPDPHSSNDRPPQGHPWHRWGQIADPNSNSSVSGPGIDASLLIKELERLGREKGAGNGSDTPTANDDKFLFVYVIRDGQVYRPRSSYEKLLSQVAIGFRGRFLPLEEALVEAVSMAPHSRIQNLPLIITISDDCSCHDAVPIFSFSRKIGCDHSFPIVTYEHWSKYRNIGEEGEDGYWKRKHSAWEKKYPWESKVRRAVWRGSPTGKPRPDWFPNATSGGWRELPRAQLVRAALERPDLMDAAFAAIPGVVLPQVSKTDDVEIRTELRVKRRTLVMEPFMKYRAIIDIDGNSWSSRFGPQLCFNSVTIKVQPEYVDYFHDELVPWKHYLPVHGNLSNLIEIVSYALDDANADAVQSIISSAQSWCRRQFTRRKMANDLLWNLISYEDLLNSNNESFVTRWRNASRTAWDLPGLNLQRVGRREVGHWCSRDILGWKDCIWQRL